MTFEVYSTNPYPQRIGKVLSNGQVINVQGTSMGKVYGDGTIICSAGKALGRANWQASVIGSLADSTDYFIDLKGNVFHQHSQIGAVKQVDKGVPPHFAQWAACLLLLQEKQPDPSIMETQISPPQELLKMIQEAKLEASIRNSGKR